MSIVAAKCPVCGRDIGFDESAAEYTCIFCGAKLTTSALKTEKPAEAGKTAHHDLSAFFDKGPAKVSDRDRVTATNLSEEEITAELTRKVGLKEDLRHAVKAIDALRKKRHSLKSRNKRLTRSLIIGCAAASASLIAFFLVLGTELKLMLPVSIVSGVVFAFGAALIIFSLVNKKKVSAAREKLEENILEKKAVRDGLIDELNAINRKLGIHHHDK
ncbi:MAG: TFIIB-type zinc ribbon-containing protein [Clostridia bacterium]|nr:TFIIB-type zinc ribbon-containing protein [Clostridia bacterium]